MVVQSTMCQWLSINHIFWNHFQLICKICLEDFHHRKLCLALLMNHSLHSIKHCLLWIYQERFLQFKSKLKSKFKVMFWLYFSSILTNTFYDNVCWYSAQYWTCRVLQSIYRLVHQPNVPASQYFVYKVSTKDFCH